MNVLVLNGGSSSIKFSLFDVPSSQAEPSLLLDGELSNMAQPEATLTLSRANTPKEKHSVPGANTHAKAIGIVLDAVEKANAGTIEAVGYRVVHPGPRIHDHARITEALLKELEAAADFAPLHDPEAIAIIRETMQRMPPVPHIACFDTIFHQTMPAEASTYAIPKPLRDRGLRRYGFHGLSCESIVRQLAQTGPLPHRMVIAHLGSGCSVTAVQDGQSIDTTMGLTPTGGIVMGTRPGDLDPGLLLYLLRQDQGPDAAANVERMLNHNAGMVALTGLPNDMKTVREAAVHGDEAALLATKVFTRSIRKAIGSFAWLLGGLDAIVFTGGIGEHDATTRQEVMQRTEVPLDSSHNAIQGTDATQGTGIRRLNAPEASTAVFAITAQEDLVIALHVKRILAAAA